jgi:hypothetical protein
MSVISYRTQLDRKFLEKTAVKKLHYRSVNAFIDHAVQKTLQDELVVGGSAKKMAAEIADVVIKYYPLKFRAATPKEEKEMLKDLEDLKSGRVKGIRMHPIKGTHRATTFSKPSAKEAARIKKTAEAMKAGKTKSIPLSDVTRKLEKF